MQHKRQQQHVQPMLYSPRMDDSDSDDDEETTKCKPCHMLDTDKVVFSGKVTADNMAKLVAVLYEVVKGMPIPRNPDEKPKLYLLINTPGGSLYDALAAYDHIRKLCSRVELITVAQGFVASAGTVLLMAGSTRLATRNTGILFHQLSAGMAGKYAQLKDEVEACTWLMKKLCRLYKRKSLLSVDEVSTLLKRDRTLSAKKCIKMGMIHDYY